ncbi:hypothetical protein GP486_007406 [Trichoglossum hirsutum]|uniref:non-specific serine/threonine protein kinase n=1 Tax=Trichoglossum hirsutum TaxID=265104 RepID=A0A9P8IBX5_9PEZI|nr:hypothetical protein GP486_007406 [Trichoglossum hirsutum]
MDENERAIVDQIIKDLTFSKSKRSTSFDAKPEKPPPRTPTLTPPPLKRRSTSPLSRVVGVRYPTLSPFGDLSVGRPTKEKRKPPAIVFASPDPEEKEPSRYGFSTDVLDFSASSPETPKPQHPAPAYPTPEHLGEPGSSYQNSLLPSKRELAVNNNNNNNNNKLVSSHQVSSRKLTDPSPKFNLLQATPKGHSSTNLFSHLTPPDSQGPPPPPPPSAHKSSPSDLAFRTISKRKSITTNKTLGLSELSLEPPRGRTFSEPFQSPSPIASSATSLPPPLEGRQPMIDALPHPADNISATPLSMSTDNLLNPASAQAGAFGVSKSKIVAAAEKQQLIVLEKAKKLNVTPPPYKLLELVGKGSFGLVFKAKHQPTNQIVAVKMMNMDQMDQEYQVGDPTDAIKDLTAEITALKELRESGAKNVNIMLDAFVLDNEMWIVAEFCTGGSVHALMKARPQIGLEEKYIIVIARELAEALKWVHDVGMIHRDIKAANILISEDGSVQLCDFGVAAMLQTKDEKRQTILGTPNWMAPELHSRSANVLYGKNVDIWAFGCTMYEMATGYPPYHRVPHHLLGAQIARQVPRLEGGNYSDNLRDLVALCLEENPSHRPPIDAVQKHVYLNNTTKKYPTSSLKQLIRDYRIWEFSGGQRNSLFSAGGAQQLDPAPDQTGEDDSWDFSTRFSSIAGNPNEPNRERPSQSNASQQPSRVPHSLQQIFYPDSAGSDFVAQWSNQRQRRISGQNQNQNRGRLSDLPLRNLSEPYPSAHQSVEIDLGTYDEQTGLSHFADNTIKGSTQSSGWFMKDDDEESQNEETPYDNGTRRATRDWTFPNMMMTPTEESPSLTPAVELHPISSSEASSAPSSPPRIVADRDDPPRPSTASMDAHPSSHFSLASIRGGSADIGNRGSFHKAWRSVPPSIDAGSTVEVSTVDMEGPPQLQRLRQASLSRQAESSTSVFGRRFGENEQRAYPPPSSAARGVAAGPASLSAAPNLTANAPESFGFASGSRPLAPLRTQLPRSMFSSDRKEAPISSASDVDEYEDSDDEPLFNVPVPAPPSQEALTEGASNEILIAEMERLLGSFNVSLEIVRTSFETADRRTRRAASKEVSKEEGQVGGP